MDLASSARFVVDALPFVFLIGFTLLRFAQGRDRAGSIVEAVLAWAAISDVSSEVVGHFRLLAFWPLLAVWVIAVGATAFFLIGVRQNVARFFNIERPAAFFIVGFFAAVTLFIALTAAPNNWDSQSYHLPRIEHWLQNGSFAYYPSWNMRQNDLAPLSEILLLQTRVLSETDFYYLLIQWISMATSIAAAFRITRQLGGSPTQCWIASVFLATLPEFEIEFSRGIPLRLWLRGAVGIAAVAAILLGPFAARFVGSAQTSNLEAMHFSSSFGIRQTLDNLTRHVVSNLAIGVPEVDKFVVPVSESVTLRLGLQAHRADTSDPPRKDSISITRIWTQSVT